MHRAPCLNSTSKHLVRHTIARRYNCCVENWACNLHNSRMHMLNVECGSNWTHLSQRADQVFRSASLGHSTWLSFSCDLSISLSLSHRVSFGLKVAEVQARLRLRSEVLLQCMQRTLEYSQQEKRWNRSDAGTHQAETDSCRLSDWSENPLM